MNRLSTLGMLLLGAMVLSKYYVSKQSVAVNVENSEVYNLHLDSYRDNQKLAYTDLSESVIPKANLLFASVLPEIDKPEKSFQSQIPVVIIDQNDFAENLESNSSSINNSSEIEETEVAPMEQGHSSVVFPMIITPSESIKQKSDYGNYPLDHGSTINSTMDRMFPRIQ